MKQKVYNLLQEVEAVFDEFELSHKDILWVGGEEFRTTWEQFKEVADRTDFNHRSQLPIDLIIMGNGWYIDIIDDDYSPLFSVTYLPKTPSLIKSIKYLSTVDSKCKEEYVTLEDLN